MDLQAVFNAMGSCMRQTRSQYQLTLGGIIDALEQCHPSAFVVFSGEPFGPTDANSYRGYYEDLAFDTDGSETVVADVLSLCRECLGKTFTGYKGGDFTMDKDTPLWFSQYGMSSGIAIMAVRQEGDRVILETKQVD